MLLLENFHSSDSLNGFLRVLTKILNVVLKFSEFFSLGRSKYRFFTEF